MAERLTLILNPFLTSRSRPTLVNHPRAPAPSQSGTRVTAVYVSMLPASTRPRTHLWPGIPPSLVLSETLCTLSRFPQIENALMKAQVR